MLKEKKILKIPRDPRSDYIKFFIDIPKKLSERLDADEWSQYIKGLNKVFYIKERPSILNFIKNILMIPSLLSRGSYDKKVSIYLDRVNSKLKPKGIYIEHPMYTSYTELVILYFEEHIN